MITASDLRKLNLSELQTKLAEEKKAVAKLVITSGKNRDLHVAKKARHIIAKIKLVISEKELLS